MSSKIDNPADPFKKALAEATRALAGEDELEVTYSADPPGRTNSGMRLPQVSRRMSADEIALARGTADGYALRDRYHDSATHAHYAPEGDVARALFDALEAARCESIGARSMDGVADNLDARLAHTARRQGWSGLSSTEDAPMAEAAGLLLRKAATGRDLPEGAAHLLDLWQGYFDRHLGETGLEGINTALTDQAGFAKRAWQIIDDLGYGDQLGEDPDEAEPDETETEAEEDEPEQEADSEDGGDDEGETEEDRTDETRGEESQSARMELSLDQGEDELDETEALDADDGLPPPNRARPRPRRRTRPTGSSPPASTRWSPRRTWPRRPNSSACAAISTASSTR